MRWEETFSFSSLLWMVQRKRNISPEALSASHFFSIRFLLPIASSLESQACVWMGFVFLCTCQEILGTFFFSLLFSRWTSYGSRGVSYLCICTHFPYDSILFFLLCFSSWVLLLLVSLQGKVSPRGFIHDVFLLICRIFPSCLAVLRFYDNSQFLTASDGGISFPTFLRVQCSITFSGV